MNTRVPTTIDRLADDFLARQAALDPLEATAIGLPGHDDELTDFSPDGHAARAELCRATLRELDSACPQDAADEVTLAAMRDRLALAVEVYQAGEWAADLNVIASPLQACRDCFDLMACDTDEDWHNIASRLAGIPAALAGYRQSLAEGVRRGLVPAARQVAEGVKQAAEIGDPTSSFFLELAAKRPDDEAVRGLAEKAAAAYAELASYLRDEVAGAAPAEDAVGRERYALASRNFVGAVVDLDETYAWGLEELDKVTAEQEALAAEIAGPGAGVEQAAQVLDADANGVIHGTGALREWMQAKADEAIAALHGKYFDIPEPVRTIEACIAPTQNGGIYYTNPSDDFSRPGRMWWSVPPGITEFSTWRELTTVYHEGVPGHHLQIGTAVALKDRLNSWLRMGSWTSGHGEGWALYAERLMEEFGFLAAPGDRLGMLDGQRMRATRVVLDIGLHCGMTAPAKWGGGRWDADKAWNLLVSNVHENEGFLRFEYNRYLGWFGQAPSYKIGQRLWEQARAHAAQAAAARGEAFDLKAFHTRALELGSVPLSVLEQALGQ
ncbi:MAG: DUF885 domain-containing protein [Propionibacteriaceae bacterium]|nr:DUF885 domain-containing protein [Propionibacteriaceae bacterium]